MAKQNFLSFLLAKTVATALGNKEAAAAITPPPRALGPIARFFSKVVGRLDQAVKQDAPQALGNVAEALGTVGESYGATKNAFVAKSLSERLPDQTRLSEIAQQQESAAREALQKQNDRAANNPLLYDVGQGTRNLIGSVKATVEDRRDQLVQAALETGQSLKTGAENTASLLQQKGQDAAEFLAAKGQEALQNINNTVKQGRDATVNTFEQGKANVQAAAINVQTAVGNAVVNFQLERSRASMDKAQEELARALENAQRAAATFEGQGGSLANESSERFALMQEFVLSEQRS